MTFDAFDQGIELGGLRNRDEIRLLICYLLVQAKQPVEKSQLNAALLANGIANYFEINQAIAELLSNASIEMRIIDDEECYQLLERGREIADNLSDNLPKTVKEKSVNSLIGSITLKKKERENEVDISPAPDDDGYILTVKLKSAETELMCLKLYVPEYNAAVLLKNNYLNDPVKVYSAVTTALTVG